MTSLAQRLLCRLPQAPLSVKEAVCLDFLLRQGFSTPCPPVNQVLPSSCTFTATFGTQAATTSTASAVQRRLRQYYHIPGRDVVSEFEAKWKKWREQQAAKEAGTAPFTPGGIPEAPAKLEWLAEHTTNYRQLLSSRMPPELVDLVTRSAQAGGAPAQGLVACDHYDRLRLLEQRFPGFDAARSVASHPRILSVRPDTVHSAMLSFQDSYHAGHVGPLVPCLAQYLLRNPAQLARRLHSLSDVTRKQLQVTLDPAAMDQQSRFLQEPMQVLTERVTSLATVLGHDIAAEVLLRFPNALNLLPQELDRIMMDLREALSATDSPASIARQLVVRRPELLLHLRHRTLQHLRAAMRKLHYHGPRSPERERLKLPQRVERLLQDPLLLLRAATDLATQPQAQTRKGQPADRLSWSRSVSAPVLLAH